MFPPTSPGEKKNVKFGSRRSSYGEYFCVEYATSRLLRTASRVVRGMIVFTSIGSGGISSLGFSSGFKKHDDVLMTSTIDHNTDRFLLHIANCPFREEPR